MLESVSPNFTMGHMVCLQYFLFTVMVGKGYFMVWGIFDFEYFHALFCLTSPSLI